MKSKYKHMYKQVVRDCQLTSEGILWLNVIIQAAEDQDRKFFKTKKGEFTRQYKMLCHKVLGIHPLDLYTSLCIAAYSRKKVHEVLRHLIDEQAGCI